MLGETYTLSNGVQIPKLGLGTWFIPDDQAAEAVKNAVKIGYRLFDTAQAYENEAGVGEGVRSCGLAREEIFVTSKIAAEAKTYEAAVMSIEETLAKMGLDYLDMMIIHSPQPWQEWRECDSRYFAENKEVWRALEEFTDMAEKYSVSPAALCIRYVLQLGTVALPKTANPQHMKENADVNFVIEDEDMETLKKVTPIENYGEFSYFPVFSGK